MSIKAFLLVYYLLIVWCGSTTSKASQVINDQTVHTDKKHAMGPLVSNSPEDVKVVVCAILKDEDKYVDEWIHYNKYLGVNHMQLYDNSHNGSAKIAALPQKYGDFVRVMHVPGVAKQKSVYADCGERYAAEKYWAAFIDCDEFIVMRKHATIQSLLHSLVPHGGGLSLFRVFFGSSNHTHYEDKPVLSRFTMRRNATDVYTKVIAYIPDIVHYDVHSVKVRNNTHVVDCHGHRTTHGKLRRPREAHEDIAAVYHFKIKSYEEFRLKRLRGYANLAHRSERYHRHDGEQAMWHEFMRNDKNAYARNDTAALDFFNRRRREVGGFPPEQ